MIKFKKGQVVKWIVENKLNGFKNICEGIIISDIGGNKIKVERQKFNNTGFLLKEFVLRKDFLDK